MEKSGIFSGIDKKIVVSLGFDRFPREMTCDGANNSPEIRIEGLDTPYLALILDDPDAPAGTYTHWILYNVPKTDRTPGNVPVRPNLDKPFSGRQGTNSSGSAGYDGPCPPRGQIHRYFFRVYGLPDLLESPPGSSRGEIEKEIRSTAKQYGEAMARYGR